MWTASVLRNLRSLIWSCCFDERCLCKQRFCWWQYQLSSCISRVVGHLSTYSTPGILLLSHVLICFMYLLITTDAFSAASSLSLSFAGEGSRGNYSSFIERKFNFASLNRTSWKFPTQLQTTVGRTKRSNESDLFGGRPSHWSAWEKRLKKCDDQRSEKDGVRSEEFRLASVYTCSSQFDSSGHSSLISQAEVNLRLQGGSSANNPETQPIATGSPSASAAKAIKFSPTPHSLLPSFRKKNQSQRPKGRSQRHSLSSFPLLTPSDQQRAGRLFFPANNTPGHLWDRFTALSHEIGL